MPSPFLLLLQLAAAQPLQVRDVHVPSFGGVTLMATYYDPGKAGPAVVLFRNCDQGRAGVDAFAKRLAARGVHVIAYDYRQGEAAGRSWRDTRNEDADRVHDWLVSQPKVDRSRIVGIGGSCGVSLTLDFATRRTSSVRGIVILSGPSDSSHKAFIARTPSLGVLGAASVEEGAAVGYIESVVKASSNSASRMFALHGAGHGTDILRGSANFGETALDWILERLEMR